MQLSDSIVDDSSSVDALYRLAPIGVALSLAVSVIFFVLIWPAVEQTPLIAWMVAVGLVALIRLYCSYRYLRVLPPPAQQKKWERGFTFLIAISGLLWGSIAILFFPEGQPLYQLFTVVILAGMAVVTLSTLVSAPRCYRVFLLLSLAPLIGRLVVLGGEVYFSLAFLVIFFILMLLALSQWVHALLREMQQVKHGDFYRQDVMEMLAKGAPLSRILNAIANSVEEQSPDSIASILLLDDAKKHMLFGAAPHLPDSYNKFIHGKPIGPAAGSFGTAMFTGQRVVAEDIRTHPLWEDYREPALKAGLQSCWSEPIKSASGQVLGAFAIYQRVQSKPSVEDIRRIGIAAHLARLAIERRKSEEEHELAAMVYRNSSEGMVITDASEHVIAVNEAFTQITGYGLKAVKGMELTFSARNSSDTESYRQMMEAVLATGKWQGVLWNYRKNGERFACRVVINSIYGTDGQLNRRVMLISDITEQKRSDELIWRQANYDSLIGLPNRRLFRDRLEQEIKKAYRTNRRMGLLFLDLDRFKEINDSLGHDAGDMLLVEAAKRIAACVRESDTVARLGGDEFTVILSEVEDNAIIERVAGNILKSMLKPFHIGNEVVYISVSIGITVYPDDSRDLNELLKNADLAMYAAKNAGRNCFSYFTPEAQIESQQRLQLISDLRSALAGKQLSLHYQPIIDVRTNSIRKVEALLRWQHPRLGLISPAEFIPRAEESGLINEIGDWVFREAARVSRRWTKIAGENFQVTINVSPVQFRATNAFADWLNYLVGIGVRGRNLTIEINQELLLDRNPRVIEVLRQLQNAGLKVAIDDFGTGCSSLTYLKKFDIDYLKIDQSFVRGLTKDGDDRALAEAVVIMGHKLGLEVIAEGVETYYQGHILASAGCDFAQGYLFSRPVPEHEFEALLIRNSVSSYPA